MVPDTFFRLNITSCIILGAPFNFAQALLPPSRGKEQILFDSRHPPSSILNPRRLLILPRRFQRFIHHIENRFHLDPLLLAGVLYNFITLALLVVNSYGYLKSPARPQRA